MRLVPLLDHRTNDEIYIDAERVVLVSPALDPNTKAHMLNASAVMLEGGVQMLIKGSPKTVAGLLELGAGKRLMAVS